MEKMMIEGGHPLKGVVRVSGAKNAALPILAATLLCPGWHTIRNVPGLRDIRTIRRIMTEMGVCFREEDGGLEVSTDNLTGVEAPYELVKTMRASILLLGPLLARQGQARISLPGGCAIGERPVDLHLKALTLMGAEIAIEHGYIQASAPRLKGATVFFDMPTVTGTENILMAAVGAEGETVIENAAKEPEVKDLAVLLRAMGADIEGAGTDRIVVRGGSRLHAAEHQVMPDRIEAGTYLIAGAMTRGEMVIEGCAPDYLAAVIEKVEAAGARVVEGPERLEVRGPDVIQSVDIKTMPFPGFPTDLQAQFMSLMCLADGWSMVRETIFENRFIHVGELRRMGADIEINGSQALVRGAGRLHSAPVMATDLRASASLVLAGLVAEGGLTEVHRIYHLDRGYEDLEHKFRNLGARIWREEA